MSDGTEPQAEEATEPSHEAETEADVEATEPEEGQPADVETDADNDTDEEADADAQTEDQSEEDDGADGVAEAKADGKADLADVEYEGKQYKLPPELKDALMRDRDYRHKTQEIAQERRELSAMRQAAEQVSALTQEELEVRASLQGISQNVKKFADVDWDAWEARDPDAAQRGFRDYQLLKDRQRQLAAGLQETDQKRNAAMKQELDKRVGATRDFASKNIPGWNTELDRTIGEFAKKELGVDEAWMAQNLTPQAYKAFYLAHVGAQSLERAKAKPKAAKGTQPKPLSKVKSKTGSSGRKAIEDMSFAEYEAFRKKQSA